MNTLPETQEAKVNRRNSRIEEEDGIQETIADYHNRANGFYRKSHGMWQGPGIRRVRTDKEEILKEMVFFHEISWCQLVQKRKEHLRS